MRRAGAGHDDPHGQARRGGGGEMCVGAASPRKRIQFSLKAYSTQKSAVTLKQPSPRH